MKGDYSITNLHPTDIKGFKRWHKAACPNDPLTAEERFVAEGGTLPKPNKKDVSRSDKSVKEVE